MSSETLNIYWLDDDTSRFVDFKTDIEDSGRELALDVHVHTIEVRDNIVNLIMEWEKTPPVPAPNLFMLDHFFSGGLPYKMNGNTLAHLLRRIFQNVPLVSVTAMYSNRQEPGEDIHEYTAIFRYNNLGECTEELFSIARDYNRLEISSWEALVKQLQVPLSEQNVLRMAIPSDLIVNMTPTKHSQLVRWIRSTLLQNPGFLFDELHTATYLGLSVLGFRKVQKTFDAALYRGPFATRKMPVWWQTKLRDCLYQAVGADAPDYTQSAGRMLNNIHQDDYSKCYVSSVTDAIDLVVAEAYPNRSWEVVRECFTKKNPDIAVMPPGFDQPLIIDGQ